MDFAYNNVVHNLIGFMPFYLWYERHAMNPANLSIQGMAKHKAVDEFIGQLHKDVDQAIQNLRNA